MYLMQCARSLHNADGPKKKTWNDVQFISLQASPNATIMINSPLPRLYRYIDPLAGEWICGKQGALFDCFNP